MTRPLAGLKVLEIGQAYAGPLAGMILADMGADVIKVEKPDGGDDARQWGPPFVGDDSAMFHANNRGKRSVALDIKDDTLISRDGPLEFLPNGGDVAPAKTQVSSNQ